MPIKIYCLQSHPIQYFAPLFKEIANKSICDFKVYYCTDSSIKGYIDKGFGGNVKWDLPLLEGYQSEFLKNYSPCPGTNLKMYNLFNPGIIKKIIKEKPDILLLHGWSYATNWMAIITAKLTGTKIWMKCESPLNQELKKSKLNRFVKKILLGFILFKVIDKFLYIGQENKAFYIHYKVPVHKLIFSPYCVDNYRFTEACRELAHKKNEIRTSLNIPIKSVVILFSGKLIAKKRPIDLLKAFSHLKDPNLFLVFLGDGELRTTIEEIIKTEALTNVLITGFINQLEIPSYYAMSDIFILPSTIGETWGLSVNEAMNFGLPVIVSDMVGCAKDLVKDGINGYTYPVGDIDALALKLEYLCNNVTNQKSFGLASSDIIKQYSFEKIIQEIEFNIKSE